MMMCTFDEWAKMQAMHAHMVAEHVNSLYRRIDVLELVIAENLVPEDCNDELEASVVEAVLERRGCDVAELH
jgi:hypothetical protein